MHVLRVAQGCAGIHARTCISDPAGKCVSLKECESSCYTGSQGGDAKDEAASPRG